MTETKPLEVEGIVTTLRTRIKEITVKLVGISDEDYAKLLSDARVKIVSFGDGS